MTDAWSGIAAEFVHLYPAGARLLAVAGADAERSRRAADDLAAALSTTGQKVERAHSTDGDERALRAEIVEPLRAERTRDRVVVVSGPAALLGERARRLWHSAVWQLAGDEAANTEAAAIVDVSDPARPCRRYADFCTCDIGEPW